MNATKLKELVAASFSDVPIGFRPCAFYDSNLDCIRVVIRDCSVYEERLNDRLTVLVDNYAAAGGPDQFVGFTIKGASHFCREHGIAIQKTFTIASVLNAFVSKSPDIVVQWFLRLVAEPVIREGNIQEIEVAEHEYHLQPA